MKYHRMTQGRDIEHDVSGASHYADNNAFDFGQNHGDATNGRKAYAPYDCKVTRTVAAHGAVFIESVDLVEAPNGTLSKQWMALLHTNDVSTAEAWRKNGTIIKQGTFFYTLGSKDADAVHLHLECGYGSSPDTWEGYGSIRGKSRSRIPGAQHIEKLLFLSKDTTKVSADYKENNTKYTWTWTDGSLSGGGGTIDPDPDPGDGGGGKNPKPDPKPDPEPKDPLQDEYDAAKAARDAAKSRHNRALSSLSAAETGLPARLAESRQASENTLINAGNTVIAWANRLEPTIDRLTNKAEETRRTL